jgi:hypothetical protein
MRRDLRWPDGVTEDRTLRVPLRVSNKFSKGWVQTTTVRLSSVVHAAAYEDLLGFAGICSDSLKLSGHAV